MSLTYTSSPKLARIAPWVSAIVIGSILASASIVSARYGILIFLGMGAPLWVGIGVVGVWVIALLTLAVICPVIVYRNARARIDSRSRRYGNRVASFPPPKTHRQTYSPPRARR